MAGAAANRRAYHGPALFSFGFRPFFLAGALLAAILPLVMAYSVTVGASFAPDPLAYHRHEMVFGYLAAIVAGFILTAVPNWTGRLPVSGEPLIALFSLWIVGRVSAFFDAQLAPLVGVLTGAAFLVALAAMVWREVLAGKNVRNAPVAALITLFLFADIVSHAGSPATAARAGVSAVAMLLALIGGRITPSFTRNWLAQRGLSGPTAITDFIDKAALASTAVALIAWTIDPAAGATAPLAIIAGAANFVRLCRWGGWKAIAEPLVIILHVGYLWLCVGLFMIGFGALFGGAPALSAGLHALTAGALGVMPLAVMTRATRGHTGRALRAGRATVAIYVMVNFGAIFRVLAPFDSTHYAALLTIAAVFWSAAFAAFAFFYAPALTMPRATSD